MLFYYTVVDQSGAQKKGQIEASSHDAAIGSLQKRGFIVISVKTEEEGNVFKKGIALFDGVPMKEVVYMSRQLATLFEAQVPAVKSFNLLAETTKNTTLRNALISVSQDIQGGLSISGAMNKYPKIFSDFYVNMVRAAEESGKLTDTFNYLAQYLERQYELTSKTRNALVYPAFVVVVFIVVIILMLVMVIPQLSSILLEVGGELPIYTRAVIALSDFFVQWIALILVFIAAVAGYFTWSLQTKSGRRRYDMWLISFPAVGVLFRKMYLARMSDNMGTMLGSGIPVPRTLEITGDVVGNAIYKEVMQDVLGNVKVGMTISDALGKHKDVVSPIMVQMIRVGEETGSLVQILQTLARFYKREVDDAVDTLIGLIEPLMIIVLGVGVGFLLVSVLMPIYNIASSL